MAATFGSIGEFEEGKEDWPQYVEHLTHFFAANGIAEDEKKRSVFLSVIGPNAYKLLRSVISPAKPGEKKGCQWEGHLCQMFDLSHLPKKLN